MSRLIVVSNRVNPPSDEGVGTAGGLAMALAAALREYSGIWFGWSGETTETFTGQISMQKVGGAYHLTPEFHPPRKVNPVPRRLADTSRAKRDLGFVSEVGLEEGLKKLDAWRREALVEIAGAEAVAR